jgi:hypothetical protein
MRYGEASDFLQEARRPLHEVVDASDWGLFGAAKPHWVGSPERLPILWLCLMLEKWARAERAFMVVSLLMLGLVMPELMELCRGVVVPPSVEELRSGSHEISAVPPSIEEVSQALGIEKSGDIDVVVSLSRLGLTGMWFLLVMWLLSLGCWQRCPRLSSPGMFVVFSPPSLLPTLDPQWIDWLPPMAWRVFLRAVLECRVWSNRSSSFMVPCVGKNGCGLLFVSVLGLVVGVCGVLFV